VATKAIMTYLDILLLKMLHYALDTIRKKFTSLSLSILGTLVGFFVANILSTIPGQTGDWGIIAAAVITNFYEIVSHYASVITKKRTGRILKVTNNIKIGILYGLFVDAFKLGS